MNLWQQIKRLITPNRGRSPHKMAAKYHHTHRPLSPLKGHNLREQARWLDSHHELVIGLLDNMEEHIIGAEGISITPQPRLKNGLMAEHLASQINPLWHAWSIHPDVTGQYSRAELERLLVRTWLRDGEVFIQMVRGKQPELEAPQGISFWLEALEPDFIPLQLTDNEKNLCQGIYLNAWGRPQKYAISHDMNPHSHLKTIDAHNMLHLRFVRRLHQLRGHSLLCGILTRLKSLTDQQDCEMSTARIAAAFGMYIKKGDAQHYDPDNSDRQGTLDIQPGILFDELQPGEEIATLKSAYSHHHFDSLYHAQLRAIAVGSRSRYSQLSQTPPTSYWAQQQEHTSSNQGYAILQSAFIDAVSRPLYRNWLTMVMAANLLTIPAEIDKNSLFNATYQGPTTT